MHIYRKLETPYLAGLPLPERLLLVAKFVQILSALDFCFKRDWAYQLPLHFAPLLERFETARSAGPGRPGSLLMSFSNRFDELIEHGICFFNPSCLHADRCIQIRNRDEHNIFWLAAAGRFGNESGTNFG